MKLVSLATAAALALAACNRNGGEDTAPPRWASVGRRCSLDASAPSLPTAAYDSLPADADSMSSSDARWARIARVVPGGWGGGLFLENGVPTMYLKDASRRSDAVSALNQRAVDGRIIGPDVRIRHGRWDFAQLYDWYRYLNSRLANVSIVGTAIDEAHNRILYAVATAAALRDLEARLTAIGVPCFLVAVEIRRAPILVAGAG